jgi:ubiquinone/menaquinone biosynthesis C-methylase UbiE
MLQVAREKRSATGRLIQGTGEHLPFCDSAFDLALCSFALGHMRDLSSVARELSRVLESGSNLFISDLHPEAIAQGWRVGFRGEAEAFEIENQSHETNEVVQSFCREHFECLSQESLWLGDPERPMFEQSGKMAYFQAACAIPAVVVFHFKRTAQPVTPGIC